MDKQDQTQPNQSSQSAPEQQAPPTTPPTLGRKIALWSFVIDVLIIGVAIIWYMASGGGEARKAALQRELRRAAAFDHDFASDGAGSLPDLDEQVPTRSEQVVVNFDDYVIPTQVVQMPEKEIPKGFGKAGDSKIEFASVYPKLHSSGRIIELGFFSKMLSEDEQNQLSVLPSLAQAQNPLPPIILTFNFSPFRNSCELLAISSYTIRFNAGADAFPFKAIENLFQFGRQMASTNTEEIKKMSCSRKKGGEYEIQVQGQGTGQTESGVLQFEWQLYSKGTLQ